MGRSRSPSRSRSRSRDRYRRKRSRSRSRDRRRRSRSRDRPSRSRFSAYDPNTAAATTDAGQYQQSNAIQQIMAQQLMGVQQQQLAGSLAAGVAGFAAGGIADVAAITLDRKQREAYVGNLAVGVITKELLEEFFNQALSHMMKDPIATPPVININMDAQGRFAFVEFRTRELANQSMLMDKLVEVHGRHLHVGRPKGYLEPTAPPLSLEIAAPQAPRDPDAGAAGGGGGTTNGIALSIDGQTPTNILLLSNILPIKSLREAEDRQILEEEVKEEASKHTTSAGVEAVVVPPPPSTAQDRGPGRAYILYSTVEDAIKGRKVFHTRTLDDNVIKAWFVQPSEFELAARGEWLPRQHTVAGIALPGLYTIAPLVSGISGLTALNPALGALAQSNPNIAVALEKAIDPDEVPFEEGYVKLRGFPPVVTKQHIVEFFKGCGEVTEEDIKMVHSADGTSLGEAFVKIGGEKAKLRLALARDKALLPPIKVPAEVLTSYEEDLQRRMLSGCVLV